MIRARFYLVKNDEELLGMAVKKLHPHLTAVSKCRGGYLIRCEHGDFKSCALDQCPVFEITRSKRNPNSLDTTLLNNSRESF